MVVPNGPKISEKIETLVEQEPVVEYIQRCFCRHRGISRKMDDFSHKGASTKRRHQFTDRRLTQCLPIANQCMRAYFHILVRRDFDPKFKQRRKPLPKHQTTP